MTSDLKPCPFCGSTDLSFQSSTEDREGVPSNVVCVDCGCAGPWAYLKQEQIEEHWVDLTIPPALVKLWNKRN
jgi:Lar family restriction alleviation protein